MSISKNNIVRIKRLLAMLKENRYPNFPRFLEEMKRMDVAGTYRLSARTLQRDIAFLKSEYHAPICFDHERNGYCLTIPEWSIDIPILEENEMKAAVLGARLAEDIMPAPVKQEMRKAVDSLLSVNEKGMDEKATLLSLVAMGSQVTIDPAIFQVVFECWQKHFCLELTYEAVTGKQSTHLMEPHVLAFYEGNWYVKGITLVKNGVRRRPDDDGFYVFALHRILAVKKLPRTFTPDQKLIEQANQRELFIFPKVHDIRLKLGKEAIKFLSEQFEFEQEGRDGEFYVVRIPSAPAYRIINFVLVEGGDAQLLNHPELQQQIIARARRCIAVQSAADAAE